VNKTRQIGFSTIIAAEGLHAACTRGSYKANYISVNQDEARDKIEIARSLYHSIPDELKETGTKPVLWNDAADNIAFHGPPHKSELISQPASAAVRGGKKDIYFDEAAHIRDFAKLYQAALPAIIRGEGRITVVSTPMDESGLFYDIASDEIAYPFYSRHVVPWWEASIMVKEGWLEEAMAEAADMPTEARLEKYGNDKIKSVRSGFGADIQGFQVEFECQFVDELEAYYPWDLIISARDDDPDYTFFKGEIPLGWEPEGFLTLGVDLAKERDYTVFILVEHVEVEDEIHRYVRWAKATQEPYEEQGRYLVSLVKRLRPSRVSIDATGVGNVLFESLSKHFTAEGVVFTQAKKEGWATRFKGDMQRQIIHYPPHQDLMKQIHGIRRTKTENALYKFSGKKDDYFWALMLAIYGEGKLPLRFSLL
jgi:phage FluMu gp28-like protein